MAETVPGFTGTLYYEFNTEVKSVDPFLELENALSLERFNRYLEWANQDRGRAIELYTLNTQLSECLYTPLQMLEVALRNRIHTVMSEDGDEAWVQQESNLLGPWQPQQLKTAMEDISQEGREITPSRIVAALTFSFWTAMLGKTYDPLWQTKLHKIARREDGRGLSRKDFSGPLTRIRLLRNRIAHHEPILSWDLPKQHQKILELTGWLSPPAAKWCNTHCRFGSVYPPEGLKLARNDANGVAAQTG